MQNVVAWLNNPNREYQKGLDLLASYHYDQKKLKPLQQREDRSALFAAVKSLLIPAVKAAPKPVPKSVEPPKPERHAGTDYSAYPVVIAAKRDADIAYKEMMNKRAILFDLVPVEEAIFENSAELIQERGRLALEVVRLQEKVDELYDRYRFALATGKLPNNPEPIVQTVDPVLLYQKISNLQKAISKLRKKEPTSDRLALIEVRTTELETLKRQYNAYKLGRTD